MPDELRRCLDEHLKLSRQAEIGAQLIAATIFAI